MSSITRRLAIGTAVAAIAAGGAAPAFARHGADDPAGDDNGGALELRHGADDPAAHDRNDDRRGIRVRAAARRGDDRHGHRHHRRHGGDDGPNHS